MASSSRVHSQYTDEERRKARAEFVALLFAMDELTSKYHLVQLQKTRMKEKFDLIHATTTTMLAESQYNTAAESRLALRVYADTIRDLLNKP